MLDADARAPHRRADRERARRRARVRHHPPRPQARQHHADDAARRSGLREGARLRPRQDVRGDGASAVQDRGGRAARHAAVHVARGVREQARPRSPHRHLRARHPAVPDDDRARCRSTASRWARCSSSRSPRCRPRRAGSTRSIPPSSSRSCCAASRSPSTHGSRRCRRCARRCSIPRPTCAARRRSRRRARSRPGEAGSTRRRSWRTRRSSSSTDAHGADAEADARRRRRRRRRTRRQRADDDRRPRSRGATQPAAHRRARARSRPRRPKMNTMRIATPLGYSSRPPRRVWPIVLVVGLFARARRWRVRGRVVRAQRTPRPGAADGGSGSAAADAQSACRPRCAAAGSATRERGGARHRQCGRRDAEPWTRRGHVASSAAAVGEPRSAVRVASGAGSARSASARQSQHAPAPPTARRSSRSTRRRRGPTCSAADGTLLGKTPLKLEWPSRRSAVAFELRLGGYKKKKADRGDRQHVRSASSSSASCRSAGRGGTGSRRRARGDGNGLERPD